MCRFTISTDCVLPLSREPNSFNRWSKQRPRCPRLARRRADLQLPSASAALRHHDDDASAIHLLAQQPIDISPHPFTEAGHREFNMFLWMPPKGDRAGDILFADSTIFTTLFGGDDSLERFWKNIATK